MHFPSQRQSEYLQITLETPPPDDLFVYVDLSRLRGLISRFLQLNLSRAPGVDAPTKEKEIDGVG